MVFLLAFRRHDRIRPGDMGRKNRSSMPCICEFPAARVYIYFFDHEPPHLHIKGMGFPRWFFPYPAGGYWLDTCLSAWRAFGVAG